MLVRDGTYHSFIPFAPYVRGFASGAWGWRRCQGHVGAIYWDTVQSAEPLISPAGVLSPQDRRVQGHLGVLEDRLLMENPKLSVRTKGFDPEKDWFAHASWQYQCGLERHANIHLAADDVPNFIRSMLNQYAVDIVPGEYTFREHTTGGPPDKIYEEACFLERFREMLVMEDGDRLWLARATPRAWLAEGKKIAVAEAPTHFGPVSYEIVSDVQHGKIRGDGRDALSRSPRRRAAAAAPSPGRADQERHRQRQAVDGIRPREGNHPARRDRRHGGGRGKLLRGRGDIQAMFPKVHQKKEKSMKFRAPYLLTGIVLWLAGSALWTAAAAGADLDKLAGQPADMRASAYQYRVDRPAAENPPESDVSLHRLEA